MTRPARKKAERAIVAFLRSEHNARCDADSFCMCEDGDDGWAFWLHPDDTTSYVHADCRIEWCGTGVDEGESHPDRGCPLPGDAT